MEVTPVMLRFGEICTKRTDIVLAGHDHDYERFAPLDPQGILDQQNGIREIVVGTGGKNRRGFSYRRRAHSEFRDFSTFGILELGLDDKAYEWRFIDSKGNVRDFGQGVCHQR